MLCCERIGKLYQAGEPVPQILIPHYGVQRLEFGMDAETVANVAGSGYVGIFPMAHHAEVCLLFCIQTFPCPTIPTHHALLVAYGVTHESRIGQVEPAGCPVMVFGSPKAYTNIHEALRRYPPLRFPH